MNNWTEHDRHAVALRAATQLQRTLDLMEDAAREVERATGVKILNPSASRTNLHAATYAGLTDLEARAQHILDAMVVVRRWLEPTDERPLGHALKTMPAIDAALIREHFSCAGFSVAFSLDEPEGDSHDRA